MKNFTDMIVGITGIVLSGISLEQVNQIVSIACTVAIALTTCAIQCYRIIRDKDKDKEEDDK